MTKHKNAETLDFFYVNPEEEKKNSKKKKAKKEVVKKKTKATKQKKGAVKTAPHKQKEEMFNFDNEIVIGVTKIPDKKTPKNKSNATKKEQVTPKKQTKKKKQEPKSKNTTKQIPKKGQAKKKTTRKPTAKLTKEQEERKRRNRIIKFFLKWTILFGFLAGSIVFFLMTPLFNITDIVVIGNEKITSDEIISLSQIGIYDNTFKLNKKEIKDQIKENAYIESVSIVRKLPNTVELQIQERMATYILEFINGYVYINNQGYILEVSDEYPNLPILTGYQTQEETIKVGNRLCLEDLEKLDMILKIMEAANSNGIGNLVTKINMENKEDYILIFDTEEKIVYIGNGQNIGDKMRYIKKIIELEKTRPGEYFIKVDPNEKYPYFRQRV